MMRIYFILLLALPHFLFHPSDGQNRVSFTGKNLSYYYYPGAEIRMEYHVARHNNRSTVFLNIKTLDGIDLKNNYTLSYELRNNYLSEGSLLADTVSYDDILHRDKNRFVFGIDINLPASAELMLVHVTNRHNKTVYSFDIPVENDFIFPRTDLFVKKGDLPLFNKYMNEKDTVELTVVGNTGDEQGNVFAFYYNTDFKAADPPMADQTQRIREDLKISRIMTLPLNEDISIDQKGLYFFQNDTNSNMGLSLRVEDIFYPRLAHIEDVTGPLIYITTRAERERLVGSTDRKKEMDRFWLTLTKSPENAKNLIRNYYQRVREANHFFTGYKEGWKTDKGMIYLLYGPPDEVYRDEEKEEWIYLKIDGFPKLSFSFVKVKNIFTDNHYVLIRSKEYERHWYRIVDMWRKGRFSNTQAN